jgi:hypothetical protein
MLQTNHTRKRFYAQGQNKGKSKDKSTVNPMEGSLESFDLDDSVCPRRSPAAAKNIAGLSVFALRCARGRRIVFR